MSKNVRSANCIAVFLILMVSIQPLQAGKLTPSPLLKSALIPGWGQLTLDKNYGYGMLAGEVMIWSAYFYNSNEQDLRDRSAYEYALKFAHINPGDYPAQYFKNLSKYDTSGYEAGGYNAYVRQTALDLFPSDPIQQQAYIDANAIPDEQAWTWDSYTYRRNYSTMRKDILELKDQAQLITGLIIANHIISSIDMLRLKKKWGSVQTSLRYYKKSPALFFSADF